MLRFTITVMLVLASHAAFGQNAPAPAFDVASVKPSVNSTGGRKGGGLGILGGNARGGSFTVSPNALTARNATLSGCIQWAYGVRDYQVTGPGWMNDDRFDITAKAAGEVSEEQLRLMLRSLLAERFKLTFHRTSKEFQAYALTIAKNGPKLKESTTDGPPAIRRNQGGVTLERASIAQLADALQPILQTPIIDDTGLKGRYDATVDITPYIPLDGSGPSDLISIAITALQDLLGLKLEPRKTQLDVLVVDHAERTPTED